MDDMPITIVQSNPTLSSLGKQLLVASKNGNDDVVRLLMSKGAPFTADYLGMTSLHFSCQHGHVNTTALLARAGASWHSRTKAEKTPLHYAAQNGHRDVVEFLLKLNADINAVDMLQMTPVHWAIVENHFHVIKLLVEYSADLSIKNKFDRTALETAQDSCSFHIVEYLKSSLNHQPYEEEGPPASPVPDSSQAVFASFAALCGSPSLTESIPWLNQENTSGGAPVLLEGTNMVTLTEGGKMALQAWSNFYEDETSKVDEMSPASNLTNNEGNNEKVLSIAAENLFSAPVSNNATVATQPIKFIVRPAGNNTNLKTKENTLPSEKRKRKLSFQDQIKHVEGDIDRVELQRRLALAQSEVAAYREKLLLKEQEVSLWKKKLEKSNEHRT